MRIGIMGAGQIGGTLTRRLMALGHEVSVANSRGPETLSDPRQRDGRIAEIEAGLPESRWAERQLNRSVVKAFNNIYARHLLERGRPKGAPDRIALPVAGDDSAAKAIVMQLVEQLGFDAVDAGRLDESWRQQPGTPFYTTDLNAEGVRRALHEASSKRPPQFQATDKSPGSYAKPA